MNHARNEANTWVKFDCTAFEILERVGACKQATHWSPRRFTDCVNANYHSLRNLVVVSSTVPHAMQVQFHTLCRGKGKKPHVTPAFTNRHANDTKTQSDLPLHDTCSSAILSTSPETKSLIAHLHRPSSTLASPSTNQAAHFALQAASSICCVSMNRGPKSNSS